MKKFICLITAAAAAAAALPAAACAPDEESERTTYTIDAAYDGGNTLSGRCTVDYFNSTNDEITALKFNLWGNAFREGAACSPVPGEYAAKAYHNGKASYGGMEATCAEGGEASLGGDDENILEIALETPIYPDQRASVAIDFTLTLADVNARTGVAEGCVNLGNFYPVLCARGREGWAEHAYCATGDPFVSETADYKVTISMPESYTAAASGELVSESVADGQKVCTYALDNARDFALVLSEEFQVTRTEADGVPVLYYHCGYQRADEISAAASAALSYFSEAFGDYPYPVYSVVQTGLFQGGMEYPGLSMISDEATGTEAVQAAVHETAHQWWYAAVGSDQYNESWQDEGLAEYSALLFFENHPEYGLTKAGLEDGATKSYRAYFSVYSQLFEGADTSMSRPLDKFAGTYEYVNIAYNKGLLLFSAVHEACGEHFLRALGDYFSAYAYKIAPPEGLIAAFCRYADCEGIFKSFLEGNVII